MTENNVAAQAGDEPMRAAFEAWLLTGSWRLVPPKRSRNGGYVHPGIQGDWLVWQAAQVSPRATADVEQLVLDLSKWTGEGGMTMANDFVGRAKAILATTKPGA